MLLVTPTDPVSAIAAFEKRPWPFVSIGHEFSLVRWIGSPRRRAPCDHKLDARVSNYCGGELPESYHIYVDARMRAFSVID
jgi:hypothetical protein